MPVNLLADDKKGKPVNLLAEYSQGDNQNLLQDLMSDQKRKDELVREYNDRQSKPMFGMSATGAPLPSNRSERSAALNIGAMMIPGVQAAKFLPKGASWLSKAAANYGGAVGQNAAIGAGVNALEGDSAAHGAIGAGGATAVLHPLLTGMASGNPLTRAASAGLAGSGLAYGIHKGTGIGSTPTDIASGVLGAGLALKGKTARDAAIYRQLRGVTPENSGERMEAAKRLGLDYLTPAEATGIPYVGAAQGAAGKTQEGSELLFNKSSSRLNSEQKAIDRLITTIGRKEELAPEIKTLYQSSYKTSASPEFVRQLKESAIIDDAFKTVKNDSVYKDKLKGVPEESFAYLDQVKRALNDASQVAKRKGENDKVRLIKEKTDDLVEKMETLNPDYKEARATAQRAIVTNKMRKILKQKEVSGSQFFRKFLENGEKFDELRGSLKNVPEAQNQLDDMKSAFQHLINQETARTGAKLEKTSMSKARSSGQYWHDFLHKIHGGAYDKAAINLITDPQWSKELGRIKDMNSNNEKTQKLANLMTRAAGLGVNKGAKKMMELSVNQYAGEQK